MTQSNPTAVVIGASSTLSQDFTVTIAQNGSSYNPVIILTAWTGTEAISSRSISGDQGTNKLNVKVQSAAVLAIIDVFNMNGTRPYAWGENFTARVTFENQGGTAIANISVQLTFGTAIGITTVPASINGLSLNIGASTIVYLVVKIGTGATLGTVTVTAQATGDEAISGDDLTDTDNSLQVNIESTTVTINEVSTTTPVPYTRGSTLAVTIQLVAGAGLTLSSGTLLLLVPSGFTPTPLSYTDITGSGTITRTFSVFIELTATFGPATIDANFTGESNVGTMTDNNATIPLAITVLQPSNVSIIAMTDSLGSYEYVQGMQFDVLVTFQNTGGLSANISTITLGFNRSNYSSLPITPFILTGSGATVSINVTAIVQVNAAPGDGRPVNARSSAVDAQGTRDVIAGDCGEQYFDAATCRSLDVLRAAAPGGVP